MVTITSVSLPDELAKKAKKQAEKEHRTLSNYIIVALEEKLGGVWEMTVASFEKQIALDASVELNNSKLRKKDLMEWSTSEIKAHDGEVSVRISKGESEGIWVAVKSELDLRVKAKWANFQTMQSPSRASGIRSQGSTKSPL